jgi:hypothetical protein
MPGTAGASIICGRGPNGGGGGPDGGEDGLGDDVGLLEPHQKYLHFPSGPMNGH